MEVRIPALGESITEGEIGNWLKKDGESVSKNEAILEIQTDKASMEITAPASGILRTAKAAGDSVKVGEVVAQIEESGASTATATPAVAAKPAVAAPSKPSAPAAVTPAPQAAPVRAAATQSAPPREVAVPTASAEHYEDTSPGRGGVVHQVISVARSQQPRAADTRSADTRATDAAVVPKSAPVVDEPGVRRERMSRLRRRIAERLVEAQHQAAILTTFNEVDMSAVIALRSQQQDWFVKRYGLKLGFMSLFGRAVMSALREVPDLNAFIEGEDVVYHDFVHLGIAVQTERGLVVPVVRDAHRMGLGTLEKEIARLAGLARTGKLALDDMHGGTFTISNGGIFGSLLSTPILNPPQTGILGMHAIKQRAIVLDDGSIVARPMMYVALSYDHRLIDGQQAVTFLVKVKERLEDPDRMMLEA